MGLQIFENLYHRFIDSLTIGHTLETIGRKSSIGLDIGVELGKSHPCISLSSSIGMNHIEMGWQRSTVAHKVANVLGSLLDIIRGFILIAFIVQRTVFQQIVLEIGGIKFTNEGSVHVECGNTVLNADEVWRLGIGDILDIRLQGCQCLTLVPRWEIVFYYGNIIIVLAARDKEKGTDNNGGLHPHNILFHLYHQF